MPGTASTSRWLGHSRQAPAVGVTVLNYMEALAQGLVIAIPFNTPGSKNLWEVVGFDGTSMITAPAWSNGVYGPALDLSANPVGGIATTYVDMGTDNTWFDNLTAVSVAQLLFPNGNTGAQDLLRHNNTLNTSFTIGNPRLSIWPGGVNSATRAANVITNGQWQMVTFTWSSGNLIRAYIDATECTYSAQTAPSGALAASALHIFFGGRESLDGESFSGKVGGIWVWNRELTPAEVAMFVAEPFSMFRARPVQRWPTVPLPPYVAPVITVPNYLPAWR